MMMMLVISLFLFNYISSCIFLGHAILQKCLFLFFFLKFLNYLTSLSSVIDKESTPTLIIDSNDSPAPWCKIPSLAIPFNDGKFLKYIIHYYLGSLAIICNI